MTVNTIELDSSAALSEILTAPAPIGLDDLTITVARPIPIRQVTLGRFATPKRQHVTMRRRVRVDWYLIGILLLLLSSAAVCVCRLAGAVHP